MIEETKAEAKSETNEGDRSRSSSGRKVRNPKKLKSGPLVEAELAVDDSLAVGPDSSEKAAQKAAAKNTAVKERQKRTRKLARHARRTC